MRKIKAFAPATIANFIVGFDSLGASLEDVSGLLLGDIVYIEDDALDSVVITGDYAHKLPQSIDDNIVTKCIDHFHQKLLAKKLTLKTFKLTLEKRLPVGSGLGSSAASIIAALAALNAYYEYPLSNEELLFLAGDMEGIINGSIHYDNIAPSLLGGLQLMVPGGKSEKLPWFDDWFLVLYHPGIEISTKMARSSLPKMFSLKEMVNYWQKLAGFVHCLYAKDHKLAISLMDDVMIEPYRAKLIPNFELGKKAALEKGALSFGISGSGPTCFAIADSIESAEKIKLSIEKAMQGTKESFSKICKISPQGARIFEG